MVFALATTHISLEKRRLLCPQSPSTQRMQPSKAAEIPEELFEHILWHVCTRRIIHEDYRRRLSVSSLVCRYWAHQCRPPLFHRIELRTPDDVKRFCEFLCTPTLPGLRPIPAMTHELRIVARNMDQPWFHLVFLLIPKLQRVQLAYLQPCPTDGKWSWRTLHPFLPRSIPGSLMPISWLSFLGVRLHSRSTILRLLSTLPLLEHLLVRDTTFDIAEDSDTFPLWDFRQRKLLARMDDFQLCLALIPSSIAGGKFGPTYNGLSLRSTIHKVDSKILKDLFTLFARVQRFELRIEAETRGEAGES